MMNLFIGTFKRAFREMTRYYVNMLSSIIVMFIIYLLIIFGIKSFAGPSAGGTLQSTAVGYFTWMAVLFTLTDLSWTVMNEMQRGIIEQEFLSPYGPLTVFVFYEISNLILILPIMFGMMIAMFSIASMPLNFNPVFFVFLVLLMIQSQGLGFVLAGITLKFKRTNALLQLVQFAVIGFLFINSEGWKSILVPISPFFSILKNIVSGSVPSAQEWIFPVIGTAFWLTIGVFIFKIFEADVRKSGSLSIY